ncbi:uncharacterized protein LOC142572681 [Dermacentor variabilis]|uniref:uncharacterized protein LOC142572681 n=1 Tax=Dermacentor variabilis TaxID=34621 RepID=UPI003F5C275B
MADIRSTFTAGFSGISPGRGAKLEWKQQPPGGLVAQVGAPWFLPGARSFPTEAPWRLERSACVRQPHKRGSSLPSTGTSAIGSVADQREGAPAEQTSATKKATWAKTVPLFTVEDDEDA